MKHLLNSCKQKLTTGWTFLRMVKLALGLIIAVDAWSRSELLFTVLGGFLAFQAAFNYGCCGAEMCDIDHAKTKEKSLVRRDESATFDETN